LSLENIFNHLDLLIARYHPEIVEFLDDDFLSNVTIVKQFIDGYRRRGYTFSWLARSRCDFIARLDEKVVADLRSIGLLKLDFGVESGSQRILDLLRKRLKLEDVMEAVRKVARNDIRTFCSFINGVPGEHLCEVSESIALRNEIKRVSPRSKVEFYVLTPLPGTEILSDCAATGFSMPETMGEYIDFQQHQFKAPWLSRKHQQIVTAITWASFADAYDPPPKSALWFRVLFAIAKWDANLRFKHNAFGFAPEFLLADKLYEKKSRSFRAKVGG
jgi:hypothetical protein